MSEPYAESKSASLSTMKPILLHTLPQPPIKLFPSNQTTPKTIITSTTSPSVSVNRELVPSSSPSPKDHHENTLLSRPPIIVPLTQLYRTSSTTSQDNLIPGEKEKENAVTWPSPVSISSNTTPITPTIATTKVSPQSSSQSSTSSSTTTTTTTISPSFDTRASSSSTTTKSVLSSTTQKSSSIIPEISDNNVFGNRNIESETMGSIGVIPFDVSDSPYCPPVTFRDIRWPPTRTGAVTIESCPPPTHGLQI